jgi:hypothetical protein
MTFFINSYLQRGEPAELSGAVTLAVNVAGSFKDMSLTGVVYMALDSAAILRKQGQFAGDVTLFIGGLSGLMLSVSTSGTATITFGEAAALQKAGKLAGADGWGLGVSGAVVMAQKFIAVGGWELGTAGAIVVARKFAASAGLTFSESGTLKKAVKSEAAVSITLSIEADLLKAKKLVGADGWELSTADATLQKALKLETDVAVAFDVAATLQKAVQPDAATGIEVAGVANLQMAVAIAGSAGFALGVSDALVIGKDMTMASATSLALSTYSRLAAGDVDLDADWDWDFENFTPLQMVFDDPVWNTLEQSHTKDRIADRKLYGFTVPEATEWPTQQVSYPSTASPKGFALADGTKNGVAFFGTSPSGTGNYSLGWMPAGPNVPMPDDFSVAFWIGMTVETSTPSGLCRFSARFGDVWIGDWSFTTPVGGLLIGGITAYAMSSGLSVPSAPYRATIQAAVNTRLYAAGAAAITGSFSRHFICVRRTKGGAAKLTVDGVTVSFTSGSDATYDHQIFTLASGEDSNYALYERVQCFTRIISDEEVAALYRRRQPLVTTSPALTLPSTSALRSGKKMSAAADITTAEIATLNGGAALNAESLVELDGVGDLTVT